MSKLISTTTATTHISQYSLDTGKEYGTQTKNEADSCGQLECEAGDFYDQLRSTASQKLTDLNVLADIFVNIHQYVEVYVSHGT